VTTNAISFNNLTLNNTGIAGSDDIIISGALDVNGTLTVTDGDLDLGTNNPNVTTAGNVSVGASGAVTKGTGTWTFDGSGTSTLTNSTGSALDLGVVTVDGSTKTLQLASGALTSSTLTIGADDKLDINGQNLTVTTLVNNGTLQLQGAETVTITTMDTDTGTVTYVGDGDAAADTFTIKDFGATDYYNLTINSTDSNDTYQLGAAKVIAGALTVTAGTLDANGNTTTVTGLATVNGGTYSASTATQTFNGGLTVSSGTFTGSSGTVDVNGALALSGGTLTAPSGALNVSGNFNVTGGTYTHNSGTVTLDGTTDQTVTTNAISFNNLTLNNTGIAGSDDIIISGALDVNGTLTVTDGDLDFGTNNPNVTTAGNVSVGASGAVTKGTGTWTFDGSGTSTLTNSTGSSLDLGAVTVDGSTKTLQLASGALTSSTLTIGADDTLDINGQNLTVTTLVNNGTLQLQGAETVTITTHSEK